MAPTLSLTLSILSAVILSQCNAALPQMPQSSDAAEGITQKASYVSNAALDSLLYRTQSLHWLAREVGDYDRKRGAMVERAAQKILMDAADSICAEMGIVEDTLP
jgi:hypothetical protein